MVKTKKFQIGTYCFQLTYPETLQIPEHFSLFETEEGVVPEYAYEMKLVDEFPPITGKQIAKRTDIDVYAGKNGEIRLLGMKGVEGYYACYREISDVQAEIWLKKSRIAEISFDPVFNSLFALERRMIRKKQLVLHCAYLQHQGKAILFSAPSETGKTTQANLWQKYRGSQIINGDRALLGKIDGEWMAQGWPVCGTSEICQNKTVPIQGIVMLSQAKENVVTRIYGREAFMLLYSQVTVNGWNREDSSCAMDVLMDLLEQVPVYHLQCNISEKAVQCLEVLLV